MTMPNARPPEKGTSEWALDLLEQLEGEQMRIPISKRNDDRGRRIADCISALRKIADAPDPVPVALSKSARIAKANDLLERMVVLRGKLPVSKQAGGAGDLIDAAIRSMRVYVDSVNGFRHEDPVGKVARDAVVVAGRLAKENEDLRKVAAEALAVMTETGEKVRAERAEVATMRKTVEKILEMPVPGRAPFRNMHAAEQILKNATPRDVDVLRKTAAGAPPTVREYLLHEANAIERTK